ncbi:MAG: hypothetical protein WA840_16805, partial [Caulobacteraceae bacterium]
LDLASGLAFYLSARVNDAQIERDNAATHSVLAKAQTIDGLLMPAGAQMSWTDATRTHLWKADLPGPAPVLGVMVKDQIERQDSGNLIVQLARPQTIDGWPCGTVNVHLTPAGRLVGCDLGEETRWKGWRLPAETILELPSPDIVRLAFATGQPILAPQIGRDLPQTGSMSLNRDGSLDTVYFDSRQPYRVQGVSLWNTVSWAYAPDSFGQGRRRNPLTATGALVGTATRGGRTYADGERVVVRLADGGLSLAP